MLTPGLPTASWRLLGTLPREEVETGLRPGPPTTSAPHAWALVPLALWHWGGSLWPIWPWWLVAQEHLLSESCLDQEA